MNQPISGGREVPKLLDTHSLLAAALPALIKKSETFFEIRVGKQIQISEHTIFGTWDYRI